MMDPDTVREFFSHLNARGAVYFTCSAIAGIVSLLSIAKLLIYR